VTALLLANAAATLYMVGLTWFVQVVHYPLFPLIGREDFPEYHRIHSSRTTWAVLPPMAIELLTSFALLLDPPGGEDVLVVAGAVLALSTWLLTAAAAAAHASIGRDGLAPNPVKRLMVAGWMRTLAWSAHGLVVVLLLASVIEPGV
jgi:hypothetical protein